MARLLGADQILRLEMIGGRRLQVVARDRPAEQPTHIGERLPGGLRVASIDDLVDHGEHLGAGDARDRPLAPARNQFTPDPRLDLASGPSRGDVASDESFGYDAEGARPLGGREAGLLGLASTGIDAVLQLDQ